jgi:hypothetical protein
MLMMEMGGQREQNRETKPGAVSAIYFRHAGDTIRSQPTDTAL